MSGPKRKEIWQTIEGIIINTAGSSKRSSFWELLSTWETISSSRQTMMYVVNSTCNSWAQFISEQKLCQNETHGKEILNSLLKFTTERQPKLNQIAEPNSSKSQLNASTILWRPPLFRPTTALLAGELGGVAGSHKTSWRGSSTVYP
jgi:hypothetical protein